MEQFIAEFSNVVAICRWLARVTLIQLRLCLMGLAKPYGIGQDVDSIFQALRARFELTAGDACVSSKDLCGILGHPCENTRP